MTMCRDCHYTHAREMGCRPLETVRRREKWHCLKTASSHRYESAREYSSTSPPAKTPKKKSQTKKKSRAVSREKLSSPPRLESPHESQILKQPSRENEYLLERPKMKVSWPQEGELKKAKEVSPWIAEAWGRYKDPVRIDGKVVKNSEWVKEPDIEVIGADWIHNVDS